MSERDEARWLREALDAELADVRATPEARQRLLAEARRSAIAARPWWRDPRVAVPVAAAAAVTGIVAAASLISGAGGTPEPILPGTPPAQTTTLETITPPELSPTVDATPLPVQPTPTGTTAPWRPQPYSPPRATVPSTATAPATPTSTQEPLVTRTP